MRDIPFSFRLLRKSPGFAAIALLALAIGVGANTAIFSVVNAVLLRPLPFTQPDRLMMVFTDGSRHKGDRLGPTFGPDFVEWRAGCRTCGSAPG